MIIVFKLDFTYTDFYLHRNMDYDLTWILQQLLELELLYRILT